MPANLILMKREANEETLDEMSRHLNNQAFNALILWPRSHNETRTHGDADEIVVSRVYYGQLHA
jgi:hypothetical protein